MGRLVRVCALLALLAVPAAALAAGSTTRVLVTNCNKAQYKPKTIVIACGDAGTLLKNLSWKTWSTTKAIGSGVEYVNQCNPNCAAGHFKKTPATVTLSKPVHCAKLRHRVFDRLVMRFKGVSGRHATQTIRLGCPL